MNKLPPPRPNRISYVKYRQDVTRQIILPVVFVAVLVVVLAALVFVSTFFQAGDVAKWAAVAIIWMIIPFTLLLLVILAAAIGLVALLTRTLEITPRYSSLIQTYVLLFNEQVILWTNRIILPILKTKAWLTLFSKAKD